MTMSARKDLPARLSTRLGLTIRKCDITLSNKKRVRQTSWTDSAAFIELGAVKALDF